MKRPGRADSVGDDSTTQGNTQAEKSRFVHRVYTVFNAQQIDNIPPHPLNQTTTASSAVGWSISELERCRSRGSA